MANQHELLDALAFLTSRPAVLTMVCLAALNLVGLIANALFYARNQRRWRRVQARERRLDAGPVTAAVGTFTRLGAKEPTLSASRAGE